MDAEKVENMKQEPHEPPRRGCEAGCRSKFGGITAGASLDSALRSERARAAKFKLARQGCWPNQFTPFGYDLGNDRRLRLNPVEADLVRRVFLDYAAGIPITEISRQLGREGRLTRRGRTFSTGALSAIIRNPIYRGQWNVMGYRAERPDLRLVPERTWNELVDRTPGSRRDGQAARRRHQAAANVVADYLGFLGAEEDAALAQDHYR
jgi:hypothetical protein